MEAGGESNLGSVIKDIVANQKFERVQEVYIVDKQTGPYRNIQQAIDEATPGALIKISEGLYNEVLRITKPLTLEPKVYNVNSSKDSAGVILLVSTGVAIQIDIPDPEEVCKIRGVKISHSGNVKIQSYQNDIIDNEEIFGLFDKNKNSTYSLDCEYVNKVKPENMENIVVWVKSGTFVLQSSLLSLSFIVKSCNAVIPAVFVNKDAKIVMIRCEVRGNTQHETIGVVSKEGVVELNSCRFSQHTRGAILLWGTCNNNSRIIHTNIQQSDIGIHIVGEQNNTSIKRTIITRCRLGIKIGLAAMCEISGNYLIDNQVGIEVYSAFPVISKNRVQKSKQNGIGLYSYKKMICQAVVRLNHSIVGNKLNGIVVEGINNYSKIYQNTLIAFNGRAGIRVSDEAHPHILLNKIHKNLEHGVIIIENSSATVQRNEINENVKTNIGFGGHKSNNTTILQNRIKGSKGEGIFMTECCGASILRNDILENNDGIVALSSNAIVNRNFISKNKGNGVLLLKQANLELCENFISQNEAVGVYFRDKSYGIIESNVIDGNEIDVNLEKLDKRNQEIASINTVDGEIRAPKSIGCLLF